MLRKISNKIIYHLSFNSKIHKLVDNLNSKVEHSEDVTPDLLSHPGGFNRAFQKRRMGIAESYIAILEMQHSDERLHAIKNLVELSFHAKTLNMPLNTARVQIEIMKQAIKNKDNIRKQMELLSDFSLASYGHESVIRQLLVSNKRIEVPEVGKNLKSLGLGWDSHVHDNLSEGRKTPIQIILSAFIKGLSKLTLAYYDIPEEDIVFETMEAGRILGIDISIGIEFSTGFRRKRKHFMLLPPVTNYQEFFDFFKKNEIILAKFLSGLEENKIRRANTITDILDNFNKTRLMDINEKLFKNDKFKIEPLNIEELDEIAPYGQYSRFHLGDLLYRTLKKSLKKQVISLKVQYQISNQLHSQGKITKWELEQIKKSYSSTRTIYQSLIPDKLTKEYFSGKHMVDYDSVFESEEDILPDLKKSGGKITYCRPLNQGLDGACKTVINSCEYIDNIELLNLDDCINRNPSQISSLADFINIINNLDNKQLQRFIDEWNIEINEPDKINDAFEHYHKEAINPLVCSASTGRKLDQPGMGFIRKINIQEKSRKYIIKNQFSLPKKVAELVITKGLGKKSSKDADDADSEIISLGKVSKFKPNLLGDEELIEKIDLKRFWKYLNPELKNVLRIFTGFVPAYLWLGPIYAFIWFAITLVRNIFVDIITSYGLRIKTFQGSLNLDNTTQSLFWTGFSVPILGLVKTSFDSTAFLFTSLVLFEWFKFFFICIANGTYISIHNRIRKFDSSIIRANFFRSILAWPLASIFAPIGNLLIIPSIVQAKFWSDVVGAVIEGTGKIKKKIKLRKRDLLEILPLLESKDKNVCHTAMLDLLYIWAVRKRGRTSLLKLLKKRDNFFKIGLVFQLKNENNDDLDPNKYSNLLTTLFNPQNAHIRLTDYIQNKYKDKEIIYLTGLINENLVDFHSWLNKIA